MPFLTICRESVVGSGICKDTAGVRPSGCDWLYSFFFQAEDGIRDYKVTGVQTCALPISARAENQLAISAISFWEIALLIAKDRLELHDRPAELRAELLETGVIELALTGRSEERRVGKGVDLGGRRIIKKKKKRSNCRRHS